MEYLVELQILLCKDRLRMEALAIIQSLELNNCWIGAGFVRDAVWDNRHGYADQKITGDVDVIWFDPEKASAEIDLGIEQKLSNISTTFDWSVKNQARMHLRNNDGAYSSVSDAIWNWPETATAVAVRLGHNTTLEVLAPFGLDDLFELRLKPTPRFRYEKRDIFQQRLVEKRWTTRYPLLNVTQV